MTVRTRQSGLTTVEFAIVGAVLLLTVFAAIEVGRVIYTMDVLQEAARRGARVAAVCKVDDAGVVDAAVFVAQAPLAAEHVVVEYLGADGAMVANPGEHYDAIHFVRVRIENVAIPIAIPFINPTFQAPEFSSTLPRESLGIAKWEESPTC